MAITTAITITTVVANARNYGPLVCTRRSWAKKVRETASDIAKCAEDSFACGLSFPIQMSFAHVDIVLGNDKRGPGCWVSCSRARSLVHAPLPFRSGGA
jgi:hypothetical protein